MIDGDAREGFGSPTGYWEDVGPLASLCGLQTLCLIYVEIGRGLEVLQSFKQLTTLSLYSADLCWEQFERSGAEWLSGLTNLRKLDLGECMMGDANIVPLSQLTALTKLNLGRNYELQHVAPLACLSQLQWLGLAKCPQVVDIECIASKVELDWDDCHDLLEWFEDACAPPHAQDQVM